MISPTPLIKGGFDFLCVDNFQGLPALSPIAPQDSDTLPPPLKWAGGKRWLVPLLKQHWQSYGDRRLVEPFCGGLAVALGLNPRRALLNDVNPHLINFYQQLKQGLSPQTDWHNRGEVYYQKRDRFNQLIIQAKHQTPEAAQLFYYLNRTGYNGLCRFNKKGLFNVPFGRYKTINYLTEDRFREYVPLLRSWEFTCGDFETLDIQPGDVIYADPPYDVEFRQYSQGGFEWMDQERLAGWLARLNNPVIISNQATDRILALYGDLGFDCKLLDAPRRISCTGDRSPVKEVLGFKNMILI